MKIRLRLLLIVAAMPFAISLLSTCSTQPAVEDDGSIPIGVLLPLTGFLSSYGIRSQNAIELFFNELNQKGGIRGRQVRYIIEDTGTDAKTAASNAKMLINKKKVRAILGPLISSSSMAVGEICQQLGIPMICIAATLEGITQIGDFIFRTAATENYQTYIIAKFAVENLYSRKAVIFSFTDDDRAKGLGELFASHYMELGGQEYQHQILNDSDDSALQKELDKLAAFQPDVLFMPFSHDRAEDILQRLKDGKIDAIPLGLDHWLNVDPNVDIFQGGYFVDHYSPETYEEQSKKFVNAYEQQFGSFGDSIPALAYESASILANALREAQNLDLAAVRDSLAETDTQTLIGRFRFDEAGDPVKPVVIKQIESQEIRYVVSIYPETVTEVEFKEQITIATQASREDLPTIAVLDLALSNIAEDDSIIVVDIIGSAMANTGAFRILERGKRDKMLEEMEFSNSDVADDDYQIEIGKQLAADRIITGSLGAVAERYVLNIKLIDVESGETLSASYKVYKSMTELIDNADLLVIDLVSKTLL